MKAFDPQYPLLAEMYQDHYYPAFLVDKIKASLLLVIEFLQTGTKDLAAIQAKLDEAVIAINDLQEEFDAHDSELETIAREAIAANVVYILNWFNIDLDIEEALRERDW